MNFLKLNTFWPVLVLLIIVGIFFKEFILQGKLPIPADTIVGLYHPFRDLYADQYPRGIPFKNFLITDPVRQQYPWRELSMYLIKKFELPLWNPYNMAGYPLMGNQQSAPFYPFNVLFLILPFSFAWSFLIFLQPLLAGIFLYFYLRNLNLARLASILGGLTFAFCGFSVAWMEWGTILHVGLWLPLILLSIDKIFSGYQENSKFNPPAGGQNAKFQFKVKNYFWPAVFILSLASSLFAGHLQTFFYVFLLSSIYVIARWYKSGMRTRTSLLFAICYLLFAIVTAIQWIPSLQLIAESARGVDLDWQKSGWFIPWQHLVQFVAPDFFGNPTTLNYWGEWNYGEFIGYIGIIPLVMALFAIIARRDKKTLFFAGMLVLSLIFALPTFIGKLPFLLNIPFLSTAQPTRLLFVIDFSLAVLAAIGFDYFMREKKKIWHPLILVGIMLAGLWMYVLSSGVNNQLVENLVTANRNLRLPTVLLLLTTGLIVAFVRFSKQSFFTSMMYIIIVGVTVFDLIRFGWKFTPFTNQEYLFPSTRVIEFVQNQQGQFRIMSADDRILPPNFSTIFRIQTIDGYDPLYIRRYGELIAASERGKPDISVPFGFNRIITPKNYESKIIDLLGVKYVLSLSDLESLKLTKVFQEGQTKVYENKDALPRAFFIKNIYEIRYPDRQAAIELLLHENTDLREIAVVEFEMPKNLVVKRAPLEEQSIGKAEIKVYSANKIVIQTENDGDGFLMITDTFYPTWKVMVDGKETNIYITDYYFRGVAVPKGKHVVEFFTRLL